MRKRGSRQNTLFEQTAYLNALSNDYYLDYITELAVSQFNWENLPPEIDKRYLELTLFREGQILFFKDTAINKYMCLPFNNVSKLNVYGNPIKMSIRAINGYTNKKTCKDSVPIFNNVLRKSPLPYVKMFAERLSQLDRIMDVNANAQRTPVLIECEDDLRLSLENLYMKYQGNEPFIFGRKGLTSENKISVLNTQAPYVCDKLTDLKQKVWSEILTYFGIDNVKSEKKERMLQDEIKRDSGTVTANRNNRLLVRQEAAEQINAMFGLDVHVSINENINAEFPNVSSETIEGENNE